MIKIHQLLFESQKVAQNLPYIQQSSKSESK